jgi:hypothetical protein
MLDVPSRFDVLGGCVKGSPAFQEFIPNTGVIPNTGW